MKKVVAIVSGGIDSTTLLYKLVQDGYDVHALTVLYGQKHEREVESAKKITGHLNVRHKVIDLWEMGQVLKSALTNPEITIPQVPSEAKFYDSLRVTVVPNRNAILLSIASGYAVSIGAKDVFYAAHYSDKGVYPDCRKEFVEAFQSAIRLGTDEKELNIHAPFIEMTKSQIVMLGTEIGVPYGVTWSCYNGMEKHCGLCSSCRERKRAFLEAGADDPTVYEQ